jgi:hypothetical protein
VSLRKTTEIYLILLLSGFVESKEFETKPFLLAKYGSGAPISNLFSLGPALLYWIGCPAKTLGWQSDDSSIQQSGFFIILRFFHPPNSSFFFQI